MFVVVYKHVVENVDRLDGCMDVRPFSCSVQKYVPVVMYYEVCCCLNITLTLTFTKI